MLERGSDFPAPCVEDKNRNYGDLSNFHVFLSEQGQSATLVLCMSHQVVWKQVICFLASEVRDGEEFCSRVDHTESLPPVPG